MPLARFLCVACLGMAAVIPGSRAAGSVHVAAASDLVHCMDALNTAFRAVHPGVDLKVSVGSSGGFHAQIRHGAPYDVFLSADVEYPRSLIAAGLAVEESFFVYAVGRLVLWSAKDDVDLSAGLACLTDASVFAHVAIANPEHAPYGRAAEAALKAAGVWESVRTRVVTGENITQAAQFVHTGHADVGVLARSLMHAPELRARGRFFLVPESLHPPLEQAGVLTLRGRMNPEARAYLEFLGSAAARQILEEFGFYVPGPADR